MSRLLDRSASRRQLLTGAAVGAAGLAVVGGAGALLERPAIADAHGGESIEYILSVALTAEQLAVTFYTQGIAHASELGISGANLAYLRAAVVEEQLHRNFLKASGGSSLASVFSFPHGGETFRHLSTFISTLEQLEFDFIAAYLAATYEFCGKGQPRLAQIASQIGGVECEHRTLGRDIGGRVPADNVGFEPVLLSSVGEAVTVLKDQGYLSPSGTNSYTYVAVSTNNPGVNYRHP